MNAGCQMKYFIICLSECVYACASESKSKTEFGDSHKDFLTLCINSMIWNHVNSDI